MSVGYVPLRQLAEYLGRPIRVALLERRSKFEEESKSLEVQHQALVRYLDGLPSGSWRCDLQMADSGGDVYRQIVSAWKGDGKHKLLERVLADLGKYDVVLVHRMDRFGRNALAVLQALKQMNDTGVRVYCVEQGIDTADPKQAFNSGLFALLAQQASDLTSERIQENKALAKKRGGWRGGAVLYGYRVATTIGSEGESVPVFDKNGYKTLAVDAEQAAVIRDVVADIVDRGESVSAVVRDLNLRRVPTSRGVHETAETAEDRIAWSTTALMRILKNPGLMGYDVVGTGKNRFQILQVAGRPHRPNEPILTDTRWHALQAVLARRAGKRSARSEALLTRIAFCGAARVDGSPCGRPLYGPGTITRNSGSYACRTSNQLSAGDPAKCTGNSVSARGLEQLVETVVLTTAEMDSFRKALQDAYAAASTAAGGATSDASEKLTAAVEEMAELRQEAKTAKSSARRQAIAAEIDTLDAKIAELESESAAVTPRRNVPDVDLGARWESMTTAERRAVIGDLVEKIEVAPVEKRSAVFDPSRVTVHIRNVGALRISEPVNSESVACPECGETFPRPAALGVHRRYKHAVIGKTSRKPIGQQVSYHCPEPGCTMTTTVAGALQRHVTAKHGDGLALVCHYGCEEVFASEQGRLSHMRNRHGTRPDRQPTPCPACGRVLAGEQGLRIHHGRVHSTE